ncbi:hypothetical protein PIB30_039740 [Stylosanthes scabra]|uniref:Uncharacterized protein n=1 Tax=Stylosanthes scabra TaxID=79078 RepID=A0ABU6SG06_9FABA|nr:hypothetical protein [Stylosanthes scabra]
MDSNFNDDVLAISHDKRHFTLSADCKNDINSHDKDDVLPQPYEHCIRQTAYNGYHHNHSDSEAWVSSSFNFVSGQKLGLSLTSSHSTCRGSNSSNFELPQRESMPSPCHISDNSEPEMDGENHREVLYRSRHSLTEICPIHAEELCILRLLSRPPMHRRGACRLVHLDKEISDLGQARLGAAPHPSPSADLHEIDLERTLREVTSYTAGKLH